MRKQEFLTQLRKGLSGLPPKDAEERLTFYSEMIDDRIEEGLSEENAVLAVGSVPEIIAQVAADFPLAKESRKLKKWLTAWEIVLLTLGSPIWLSLGIAAIAIIVLLYVSLWSVIISLWAVFGSLAGCSFGGLAAGLIFACNGNILTGIAMIGAGIVCAGLSIFIFYGCIAVTKGLSMLTKKLVIRIKTVLFKRRKRNG